MKWEVRIADAMHNCDDKSGATNEYCKGMIMGIVSGLMATGMRFDTALAKVKEYMPEHNRGVLYPESWK